MLIFVGLLALGGLAPGDAAPNPFFEEYKTPFGVPPFDLIKNEHYLPAFRAGMEQHKKEIEAIIQNPEAPTFANTLEAMERSGALLTKVANVFFSLNSAHSNDTIKAVAKEISPELSAHNDDIFLNADLFKRVNAVYEQREKLNLNAEQMRLLTQTYRAFVRNGINLPAEKQERLRQINQEMAKRSQEFGQNLLDETNDFVLFVENKAELGPLPESLVELAAAEAEKRGKPGQWAFTLQRPSINPFLQYSPNREMRKKMFEGYAARGDRDNEKDNKKLLSELADLRAERANLMGFKTHADFILADNMAETPQRVFGLLDQVWKPALEVAKKERAALQEMMKKDGIEGDLQGWDWRYYTEKLRKEKYDLDEEAMRPYFEVNNVRDGVFMVAKNLYGITFHQRKDLPTWHPDQQVFEVKDKDGSHLGIVYLDFFARESKRGGAWMNDLRAQSKLDGVVHPIVTTNFNFPAPTATSPSLLSFTEAQTLFHEFGHALHGLLSNVTYASLSGTNTPRDYVEFPSQVMENWMSEPEVLKMYAKHYKTGQPIPEDLVKKIEATSKFDQGFATVEYMAAAYLDMYWHTLEKPSHLDARAFEKECMDKIGLIPEIIPRYRSGYFAHIFSGGYSAGYYSYLWSEVLDADAYQAFKETSVFDQKTADKYRTLLSRGGSRPGMDLYREFRGRDPKIDPLLERRGLK
ncbi:MAG: M3 family metallopeptidase [Acidobacteria bacterium]|nr:M3 family metallopeptidase [Acidobacteriota bacterium]